MSSLRIKASKRGLLTREPTPEHIKTPKKVKEKEKEKEKEKRKKRRDSLSEQKIGYRLGRARSTERNSCPYELWVASKSLEKEIEENPQLVTRSPFHFHSNNESYLEISIRQNT